MEQALGSRDLTTGRASEALLELVAVASSKPIADVLDAVSRTLLETVGFRTVVLNIFRPEWDHYEAVQILGTQDSRDLLLGTTVARDVLDRLLADADRSLGNVHFLAAGSSPAWEDVETFHSPSTERSDHPDAWDPEDALLVLMTDADGEPLGFASMDEPESGCRPSDAEMTLVGLVCSYAEHALRVARWAEVGEEEKRFLTYLTEVSPRLSACATIESLRSLVLETITEQFGFERVASYERQEPDLIQLGGTLIGWEIAAPLSSATTWSDLDRVLGEVPEQAGCHLLPSAALRALTDGAPPPSRRNGRGPRGWSDHWLVIPWMNGLGAWAGVIILDNPRDRLVPTLEKRRTLRLLIDLAARIRENIRQREALHLLASHDPLTGVLNRRELDPLLSGPDLALLLCDIDHFKEINDRYGHEVGDRVLASFGELLRDFLGTRGAAVRFGGDEFCVVLPHLNESAARAEAEQIQIAAMNRLADVVPEVVMISVGVAVRTAGSPEPGGLLGAADRSLYRVKHARPRQRS